MDMDPMLFGGLIALLLLLVMGILILLYLMLRRPADTAVLLPPLQGLAQTLGNLQTELRGLTERVSTVERAQLDGNTALREGLSRAQESLAGLQAQAHARQDVEQRTTEAIRRLEAVIAGTQTRGAGAPNIMELLLGQLPPEWQVRNLQVGNRMVEFGLRLPNNLVLPIDSQSGAASLLEQFLAAEDPAAQEELRGQIERAVLARAKEVNESLDPNVTVSFGVATVPDAVFDLCSGVQVEALQLNVVLLSYSMFVPYLLLVFQMILRTSQNIDLEKLSACLESLQGTVKGLQYEVEGRFSRAIAMLNNSRDELRAQIGKVSSDLTGLQIRGGAPAVLPEPGGAPAALAEAGAGPTVLPEAGGAPEPGETEAGAEERSDPPAGSTEA